MLLIAGPIVYLAVETALIWWPAAQATAEMVSEDKTRTAFVYLVEFIVGVVPSVV
jgi:hypothetical protein